MGSPYSGGLSSLFNISDICFVQEVFTIYCRIDKALEHYRLHRYIYTDAFVELEFDWTLNIYILFGLKRDFPTSIDSSLF